MLPVRIKGYTTTFAAPRGWDEGRDGKCAGLAVRVEEFHGMQFFTSAWEPTPDEIARIVAGGKIEVTVWGGQPPIALAVGDPP